MVADRRLIIKTQNEWNKIHSKLSFREMFNTFVLSLLDFIRQNDHWMQI